MKRKILSILLFALMLIGCCSFFGCSEGAKPAVLVDTYNSATNTSYMMTSKNYEFYQAETITLDLYSDNTYACHITLSEGLRRVQDEQPSYGDLATVFITRYGTYEITSELGEVKITLSEATRVTYGTNAGGGHTAYVPEGMKYCDSANEEDAAKFFTEHFGDMEALMATVGKAVTLVADEASHIINADSKVFDHTSCILAGK